MNPQKNTILLVLFATIQILAAPKPSNVTKNPLPSERFQITNFSKIDYLNGKITPAILNSISKNLQQKKLLGVTKYSLYSTSNTKTLILCVHTNNDWNYPFTLVIKGSTISEVNFKEYEFMYDYPMIKWITDIDRNQMPEFWLEGEICECGSEEEKDPEGCQCEGLMVGEFSNGSLKKIRDDYHLTY